VIPIDSSIEGVITTFQEIQKILAPEDFNLGGAYTYDHGYFDKALDWEEEHGNHYYLRIPTYAIKGYIGEPQTKVTLGKPFIIKHDFLTSNDPTGDIGVVSYLFNQFTKPLPSDAEIDQKWIARAKSVLRIIEGKINK
jgi:hypothetical protein